MLYTPLLPGTASGSLEPRHVVVPLREELSWTELRLGRVTGADPTLNQISIRTVDEREETLRYDQLIVALGSIPRVLRVPGLAEHGVGFQTLADAPLPSKHTSDGLRARRALLRPLFGELVEARPRGAEADDVLDAFAVLWSVERFCRGDHIEHGDGTRDACGLPMRIIT